jgi:hypothetical protein
MEFIKGQYRDLIISDDELLLDSGWKSNSIHTDCGRFIAALMKKEFKSPLGIEFIVFGGPQDNINPDENTNADIFRERIGTLFYSINKDSITPINASGKDNMIYGPIKIDKKWVCAVKLEKNNVTYNIPTVNGLNQNQVKVFFSFRKNDLATQDFWSFNEFSLIGIDTNSDGKYDTNKLYLINYVSHPVYKKDKNVSLERTIILTFPPVK